MMDDKTKAELSEIVDGQICLADVTDYDSLDDFEEEILSAIEVTRELSGMEHKVCSELIGEYWQEHGGDDDREAEDEDE
jgi:hypothetical protein